MVSVKQNTIVMGAPCKINLFLNITGLADNGYHLLETVMHSISLEDTVTVSLCEEGTDAGIEVLCSDSSIASGRGNIAYKAARAFFDYCRLAPVPLKIHIDKNVPHGAGLGGGSADAAAVIKALNILLDTKLDTNSLASIALSVGADVPFCLFGGCALATGIGEKLNPLTALDGICIAVVKPNESINTKEAYQNFDSYTGEMPKSNLNGFLSALACNDIHRLCENMYNSFEITQQSPITANIKEISKSFGSCGAVLSGSGSAVAAIFKNEREAQNYIAYFIDKPDVTCFLAQPLPHGVYVREHY